MRMLFLGLAHPCDDARLYYREIMEIRKAYPEAEIYFMGRPARARSAESCRAITQTFAPPEKRVSSRNRLVRAIQRFVFRARAAFWAIQTARQIAPQVTQASDVREILLAMAIKLLTRSRIVYDSHEDYFNQVYEYAGKTARAAIFAYGYAMIETLFLRFFDAIFCTDEYLVQKYSQTRYGIRRIALMRNYVNADLISMQCSYEPKSRLALVYHGGVNRYRGVMECASFVARFNHDHAPGRQLAFSVYSPSNAITAQLAEQGLIDHYDYLDHPEMLQVLPTYDVGVCLWQRLTKFEHNLPIKNFEYMAVGLPVLTSDFGNLRTYIRHADSGYCIDPNSYEQFEQAMMQLFDARVRMRLGNNGRRFTQSASFHSESRDYVAFLGSCLTMRQEQPTHDPRRRCAS